MASLLDLLGRAKTEKKVAYGDTTYLPITDTQSLNGQVSKYEARPNSLEKVLKKELKRPINGINDLFDKADRLIIDTRGIVNPYRTKILTEKFQSNTTGGEILKQAASLAGAILKQRVRIADTIFPDKTKPGPISQTITQPQHAARGERDIEPGTYYVKTQFKPGAEILGGAGRAALSGDMRAAKQEALQAGLNLGRALGRRNKLNYGEQFIQSSYHPAGFDLNLDGRIGGKKGADNGEEKAVTFGGYKEYYLTSEDPAFNPIAFNGVESSNGYSKTLQKREDTESKYHQEQLLDALVYGVFPPGGLDLEQSVIPWVYIKPMGYDGMYFPGTISGLSENVTGTWENFKYIGSPFSAYKYNGVERTLNFTLNLYWTELFQILRVREQLEYIKELCFPSPDVSIARYKQNKSKNQPGTTFGTKGKQYWSPIVEDDAKLEDSDQLFYRPQFVELTIHGYAKKLFGFMETINVNVPDNASWPSVNVNSVFTDVDPMPPGVSKNDGKKGIKNSIFPSNVNVEFSMKIIENPTAKIDNKNNIVSYKYNLDGHGTENGNKYPARRTFEYVKKDETAPDNLPTLTAPNIKPIGKPTQNKGSKGKKKPNYKWPWEAHPLWKDYAANHAAGEAFGTWLEKRKRQKYPWEKTDGRLNLMANFKNKSNEGLVD